MPRRDRRKDLQLCAQVRDAVEIVLMEAEDDALDGAWVREVVPNPDSKHVLVVIEAADPAAASAAAASLRGVMRREVAGSIHRKRTPELSLQVVPRAPSAEQLSR